MRVLLVGPYPRDPSRFGGGVETSFYNLVDGIARFPDIEPHIVTFVRGATETRHDLQGSVPVTYLPARARFNNLTLYGGDRRLLAASCRSIRPDIVHAQDAIGYGFVALRSSGDRPVVVSIHGIVEEELQHYSSRLVRLRTRLAPIPVQRYTVRHARYLLQPSPYPKAFFEKILRGQVATVGNPISDRFFALSAARERGSILFVGGISPVKRVKDLIDVFALVRRKVPDAKLRIAGGLGETKYATDISAQVRAHALENVVTFLGALSPDQLVAEYARAEVFALTSAQENSPMVIGEAMAAGVPVVATNVGGVKSLVADGVTGFLAEVGDVHALADHISTLLNDEAGRLRMGQAARLVAEERFRPVEVARRVREVYREIMREQGQPDTESNRDSLHEQESVR
jgi:glycosyltransferase involved in cell wall biosynthesis